MPSGLRRSSEFPASLRGKCRPEERTRQGRAGAWTRGRVPACRAERKDKHMKLLVPNRGKVTEEIMQDALLLIGEPPADSTRFTQGDRKRVYDWAMRVHIRASDNVIAVPKRPACLNWRKR